MRSRGGTAKHTSYPLRTRYPQLSYREHSRELLSNEYLRAKLHLQRSRLTITHENVLDGTVEGVECAEDKMYALQFYPESAPGPQDCAYLFDKFIKLMEEK